MSDHPATPFAPTSMLAPRHEANVRSAAVIAGDEELLEEVARVWHRWTLLSSVYTAVAVIAVGGAALAAGVSLGVVLIATSVSIVWFMQRAVERELEELGVAPALARALLLRSLLVHESYEPQLYMPGKVGRRHAKRALRAALRAIA